MSVSLHQMLLLVLGAAMLARVGAMFTRERLLSGLPLTSAQGDARARVIRGKYRRVSAIYVGFPVPAGWRFNLRRENLFDRFAKAIGLAREFQTHDAAFDPRIYIECDDRVLHRQVGANRAFREQVVALFRIDAVRRLQWGDGWAWFVLGRGDSDDDLSDEQIGAHAASLLEAGVAKLRAQLASPAVSDETARDPTRVTRRHFAFGMLALAVAAAIGGTWQFFNEDHQIVMDHIPIIAWQITVGLTIAMLLGMLAWLGGTSRAQRVLLDVLIAGIPAAWLAASSGAMYFNEALDGSAARRVPISVERSWYTTNKKGHPTYFADLRWPDARGARPVRLSADEYGLLQTQSCIDVLWHAGRFGDGWIERYQPHVTDHCEEGVE